MSAWIPDFITYCKENDLHLDFVSTHEYPTDPPGPQTRTFFIDRLKQTREIVGDLPLYYTEYDDGYNDATSYSAAFAVYQNYLASGVVDALSWWPFSDIFEEAGLYPDPYPTGTVDFKQ
jgi:xylan 1,4-beta-xylosidase